MIPWVMIVIGGVMVFSGVKSTNPLAVLKGVLDGSGVPSGTTQTSTTTGTTTNSTGTTPSTDATGGSGTSSAGTASTGTNSSSTNRTPLVGSGGGRVAV